MKGGLDSCINSYSDEDFGENDEVNENEEEEIIENEFIGLSLFNDNELISPENEDYDNNYIDDLIIGGEEEFNDIKINDNLIFQR